MKRNKYSWMKCIRNYRFHSIFLKNLALIFGVILLPFICMLTISTYIYGQLQMSEKKAYTEEKVTEIFTDLENLFLETRQKAVLIAFNENVELFSFAKTVDDDMLYDTQNIIDVLSLYNVSTEVIDSIYVYAPYCNGIISASGRSTYDWFLDKGCIDAWKDNGDNFQIIYLSRKVIREQKDTLSFYYITPYYDEWKNVVIINLGIQNLEQIFDYGDHVSVAILGREQVLFDSTGTYNGVAIENAGGLLSATESEIMVRKEMERFGLEFVVHIDSESLYTKLGNIKAFMLIFIGVMLLLSIFLVFYISQRIFDPISDILNILEDSSSLGEEDILKNKNEVGYIRDSIYATISRNKDIEEELSARIKLLKKAQAVALQAQINPHFINNTLDIINWTVDGLLGEDNDVSEMLNSLSQILRFSLQDSDTFVTLKEELEYVKKYLFIQLKRLNHRFDVVWEIPDEILNCKVIKMVLQPVIENAINYGIKPYDGIGELRIEAMRKQNVVCILVKDSGLGISQEEADEINRSIRKQVIKESNHIGLSNVNQRIILAFGEEYGVTVMSKLNEGTTVELVLPYQV